MELLELKLLMAPKVDEGRAGLNDFSRFRHSPNYSDHITMMRLDGPDCIRKVWLRRKLFGRYR